MIARCLVGLFGDPGMQLPAGEKLSAIDAAVVKLFAEAKVATERLPLDDPRVERQLDRHMARARNGATKERASAAKDQAMREATRVGVNCIKEAMSQYTAVSARAVPTTG